MKKYLAFIFTALGLCLSLTPAFAKEKELLVSGQTILPKGELIDKRTEFEKHYFNDDGTFTAVTYAAPIHYKNAKGEWTNIDNTLIENKENNIFSNKDNPVRFEISKNSNSQTNKLITAKYGNYELSWNVDDLNSKSGVVDNGIDLSDDPWAISTLNSQIKYNDVFSNTDLKYTLTSYNLVEEFIFNEIPTFDTVKYNIQVKNLKAKQNGKEIVFVDSKNTEKEVFKFTAPFLKDSASIPAMNTDIEVSITENSNGYTLINKYDMDWMKDSSRVYPITLDPTVTSVQSYSNIADTHTNSNSPNTNYQNSAYLHIGKYNGKNYVFIKINTLPTIPSGGTINTAHMNFYLNYGSSTWGPYAIYKINNSWSSGTLKWNNQSTVVNGASFIANNITPTSSGGYYKYNINITNAYNSWVNGTSTNYGVLVKYQDDNYNDCNFIYSSDNTNIASSYLPAITVNYSVNDPYAAMNWHYPLPTSYHTITYAWQSGHPALDISVPVGKAVYAVDDGEIDSKLYASQGYGIGNALILKADTLDPYTGNHLLVTYGHLNSMSVSVGDTVTKGQIIGYSGNSGTYTTGPHLQIEMRNDNRRWVSFLPSDSNGSINPVRFWPSIFQ